MGKIIAICFVPARELFEDGKWLLIIEKEKFRIRKSKPFSIVNKGTYFI